MTEMCPDHRWRPLILDPNVPDERNTLERIRDRARHIFDTLDSQKRDLIRVLRLMARREPRVTKTARSHHSRWVYYPWSSTLVHLLSPDGFRLLRSSRNLYKITSEEQDRLRQLTIGLVGLSAGAAVAMTLVLEGIGCHLKLADFDTLELSNMNRLRAGVHQIGLPKTVLVARQIMELDPYLRLTLYRKGVTRQNIDEFMGGDAPVNLVIDECDTTSIKVLLRERAREARVPVIMETSDRGLLDIERFDLESDRPILHGRLGQLDSVALERLPRAERLAVAAQIVGSDSLSTRLAASAMEIEHSIVTWPQLGSATQLGGASVTAAVRRIALGHRVTSGRRYCDLDRWLSQPPEAVEAVSLVPPRPNYKPVQPSHRGREQTGECTELVQFVVEHAALAPSVANDQPWRFHACESTLWLLLDEERGKTPMGPRQVYLSLGAALENLCIAAASRYHTVAIRPFPQPGSPHIVAESRLVPASSESEHIEQMTRLLEPIRLRATNRKAGTGEPLSGLEIHQLQRAAHARDATLEVVTDNRDICEIARIVSESDRIRYLCKPLHRDLFAALRWNAIDARLYRDGIYAPLLAMSPSDLLHLRIAGRPDVARFLRALGGGKAIRTGHSYNLITSASAVGMLSMAGDSPQDWLTAGRAMERVWLEATRLGLGVQPVGRLMYMRHLFQSPTQVLFRGTERRTLSDCARRMDRFFTASAGRVVTTIFRFVRAPGPAIRSLRRPLKDILIPDAPSGLSARMSVASYM